jgi:glycosyltransferase involved in cell wall biosynthesis
MPKVSIIINCHNGERHLKEAIDSIYSQTFGDWEIIFFDNSSTDGSAVIAKQYDNRLKYKLNNNLIPLGAARKLAVELASGEWVAFLDVDDKWYENKLKCQLDALEGTGYVACYAGIREITEKGNKIRDILPAHSSGNIFKGLLQQFDVNMVTPMFKREIVLKYGITFDPEITASEEYNFFVRISAKGEFLVQRKLLGEYRVSPGSLTDRQIKYWARERRHTLNSLEIENEGIKAKFPEAFREAEARAAYYEAQYLMSEGRENDARKLLWQVRGQDYRYNLLYFASRFSPIWRILHKRSVRSKILSLIKSI